MKEKNANHYIKYHRYISAKVCIHDENVLDIDEHVLEMNYKIKQVDSST